ncbi:MAG: hypothetical protein U5K71_06635 [Gracilimonas sp.]|nr:hypothetical protein [Gracilimonas sp.]
MRDSGDLSSWTGKTGNYLFQRRWIPCCFPDCTHDMYAPNKIAWSTILKTRYFYHHDLYLIDGLGLLVVVSDKRSDGFEPADREMENTTSISI